MPAAGRLGLCQAVLGEHSAGSVARRTVTLSLSMAILAGTAWAL